MTTPFTPKPRMLPGFSAPKVAGLELAADIEKYAVINERGTARNLSKLNLSNSIYEEVGDSYQIQVMMGLL